MNNSESRCTTISPRGDKVERSRRQASSDPYFGFSSCSHHATTRNQTLHSDVVGPCKKDVSYRRATRQIIVGRCNVSNDSKENVASSIIGQEQQEQEESDDVLGPPYNSRDGERIEISLNDSGKWPFPFLNEDLCCYYDSMDVTKDDGQEESCELPLGVQEENNRSTGARPPFLSPYLGITCYSAVSTISNINSISLFRNIYQLFKQQRNIIMVGCILVIAVFSSTALVDHSRGHRNVALNVISDINDDDNRAKMIKDVIIDSNVSHNSTFGDEKSPQSLALEWITNVDPMHLLPTDDNLLQRYACAVFYFSSTRQSEIPFKDYYYHDKSQNLTTVWLSQEHVCAWSGITCGNGDGNITSFIAKTGNVQGPLVREILVAFPKLEILQLNNMGLQKELPSEIGLLSNLKVLSLGNNELSGNIPTSLGQLTQLQLLGLQNNLFQDEIPREIWTMKELSAIYLDGNRLTGTIPTEVENLDKLLDFRLRNNRMKGSIPSSLGTLTGLRILYLDNNKFNGVVPKEIGRMLELESLTLHENNFVSSLPIDLGNLTNLKHLIISNNTLSGSVPKNVLSLPQLNFLWFDHNDIVGNISNQICQTMNMDIDIKVDCHFITCECCGQCVLGHDENVFVEDLTESENN